MSDARAGMGNERRVVKAGLRRQVVCSLALVTTGLVGIAESSAAVEAETTQEKTTRLHQQAQPDMFRQWSFDKVAVQELPAGFTVQDVHAPGEIAAPDAKPTPWQVRADTGALSVPNLLTTTAHCDAPCLHVLTVDGLKYEYPDVSIRIRTAQDGGKRSAGLIFGWQDPQNFYLALVDLDAAVVELSKVVAGQETLLGRASVTLKSSTPWHALRALRNTIISKDLIEVSFDGRQAVTVQDQSLGTGAIGLAARGTGPIQFDNFHAAPLFSQRPFSNPAAY